MGLITKLLTAATIAMTALTFTAPSVYANDKSQGSLGDRTPEIVSVDTGGSIIDYINKYNYIRRAGGDVRIDDVCISACTLVLGLVPLEHVCASSVAQFGFHSAGVAMMGQYIYSEDGTDLLWALYPENVKEALRKKGFDPEAGKGEHPRVIYLPAKDFVQECR